MVSGSYAASAYRLSLLSLIGDVESAEMRGRIADLARLPLQVELSGEIETVARDEVAEISLGVISPQRGNSA